MSADETLPKHAISWCSEMPLPPAAKVTPFIGDTLEYIREGPICGKKHHDQLGNIYR